MTICKYCGSTKVFKKGRLQGVQRYLCPSCNHTFLDKGQFPDMNLERLHGTIKDRTKVTRGLKDTTKTLLDGYAIHYNFVRHHSTICRTPAQAAKVDVANNWHDLIQLATIHKTRGG